MIVNNVKFETSAVRPQQYPAGMKPEVAFAGRSNVGKSSMINTLLNRKSIARVGATPGKTREINFYHVEDKLYFVDLPGYGYAKVSKEQKASWGEVIETYLNSRTQLALIFLLVDIRHTPTEDDRVMYAWIQSRNVPCVVVATKSDKIPRSQVKPRLQDIAATLGVMEGVPIIPFSAEKKQGKDELWEKIHEVIR